LTLEKIILIFLIHPTLHTSQLVFQMIFELSRPIELTSTVVTAKLPILVVSPHMVFQVSFGDKVLGADFALIVAVTIVRLQMNIQVAFLCEFVSTKVAAIGLDPKVLPDVNLQS
jgi:hypothetical protein